MGIAKKGLTLLALTFSISMSANAAEYVAADDSPETKLCLTAATQSKMAMTVAVKKYVPGTQGAYTNKAYRKVANELYCNGVDVAEFAMQAGNQVVAQKLQSYRNSDVKITDIAKVVHEGKISIKGSK